MKKAGILATAVSSCVFLSLATLVPVQAAPHGHSHRGEMLASNCHATTKHSNCYHAKQAASRPHGIALTARGRAKTLAQSTDDDLFGVVAAAAPAAQVANNDRSITTTAASDRYLRKLAQGRRSGRLAAANSGANANNNDDDFDIIVAKIMIPSLK